MSTKRVDILRLDRLASIADVPLQLVDVSFFDVIVVVLWDMFVQTSVNFPYDTRFLQPSESVVHILLSKISRLSEAHRINTHLLTDNFENLFLPLIRLVLH